MHLCLIDGYGFVFRAYHSLPPLTREDGTPIACVYGFCNMLSKLLENHHADYIAVVLDSGTKNFRHNLYPEYKANRPAPSEDLLVQFPLIREAIEAFNIKIIEQEGYEADDLIALYAQNAIEFGVDVKIISSDKDLMQLINNNIILFDPIKNIEIKEDYVAQKFGVQPEQMVDYLALIGDASDNIPGAKGIGPKGAVALLTQFGTLDNIYQNIDNISKERTKKLLIDSKDAVYLSKELVNLRREYNIKADLVGLKVQERNDERLLKYLKEQGFKSLVSRIFKNNLLQISPDKPQNRNNNFTTLTTINEVKAHMEAIIYEGKVAIFVKDNIFYFSYGSQHNFQVNFIADTKQESLFGSGEITFIEIINVFKTILESNYVLKILIDAKTFYKTMHGYSIELKGFDDIAQMSYSIETGKHNCEFKDLIKEYCVDSIQENSASLINIYHELQFLLFQERKVDIYESIEKPLITILAKMEIKGIKVDDALLKSLSLEFKERLAKLEKEIFEEVGREFLISSPKQLSEVLFVELGIKGGKKSKLGTFSTSASILEELSEQGYTIADKILEWRQFAKLINTYTEALTTYINPKTQRVHTTFMMSLTNTSRLSSRDPNLQNIPIRTEEGQKIRKAFMAGQGNVIISADYSQIELRLLAHAANIDVLKNAFKKGEDIHAITASQLFKVPIDEVNSDLRRKAKTINFGIIYGISAFGLSKRLDIAQNVAKQYIETYFNQYPGIKEYMESTIQYARTHGYVENLFGRRCYIKNINDKNFALRTYAERAAINAPLQSGNADIIKKAMARLPLEIQECMVLQIHDELLFEVPENKQQEYSSIIQKIMEGVSTLSVPLKVELHIGKNWGK